MTKRTWNLMLRHPRYIFVCAFLGLRVRHLKRRLERDTGQVDLFKNEGW